MDNAKVAKLLESWRRRSTTFDEQIVSIDGAAPDAGGITSKAMRVIYQAQQQEIEHCIRELEALTKE